MVFGVEILHYSHIFSRKLLLAYVVFQCRMELEKKEISFNAAWN